MLISILDGYNTIDAKKISKENIDNVLSYYKEKEDYFSDDKYIGVLSIPDINLERGFYPIGSPHNDLSKNILFLKESILDSQDENTIILAAHRGNSKVSFFNDLDKLELGCLIKLNYKNKEYTYTLDYKYDELKDGHLNIYRDKNKPSLILITCNKKRRKYQTIYVAYRREDVKWLL